MIDYLSELKKDLLNLINYLLQEKIIQKDFKINNISIDYLSKSKKGDVSTNLFILLKKNKIDKEINLENILNEKINNFEYIEKINIAKEGFINIFFDKKYIIKHLNYVLNKSKNYGRNNSGKNKKINIEFVSANPTGPIHIAHLRGAVFGDVISSIMEENGFNVTREYYINDSGTQIEVLGNSLFKRYQQLFGKKTELLNSEYPGEYLIDLAKKIKTNDNDKWLDSDELNRKKYFQKYAVQELLFDIKNDLQSLDIIFDNYVYESKIIEKKLIAEVILNLNDKKLIYEGILEKPKGEDQIDWSPRKQLLFKSTKFLDEVDRPLKKENGEWTYFANDAAYHYDKYLRKYNQLINIWGADHIGYIKRMESIISATTNNENYLKVIVCQIVRLFKDGQIIKMSKRDGNFITLKNILKDVNKDSLRYFMISTKNETPIDFNLDKVIDKNKDNPVFYCQYAYARASSIINKSKDYDEFKNLSKLFDMFDYSSLSKYEWNIILKIISWPYLLKQTSHSLQPHKITNYIEDLSSNFHSFWNMGKDNKNLRFLNLEDKKKTITKLLWIECFRIVLKRCFEIIGIESHEKM